MQRAALVIGSEERDVIRVEGNKDEAPIETITREDGVKVSWHDGIEVVPGKLRGREDFMDLNVGIHAKLYFRSMVIYYGS